MVTVFRLAVDDGRSHGNISSFRPRKDRHVIEDEGSPPPSRFYPACPLVYGLAQHGTWF
jgi:hypothetical protein